MPTVAHLDLNKVNLDPTANDPQELAENRCADIDLAECRRSCRRALGPNDLVRHLVAAQTKQGGSQMYIELRRNAQGILQAHAEDPQRDRDRLFDLVMSLSDFALEKGFTEASLQLEGVLDAILEQPVPQMEHRASA